jgi:hypothetical protein
VSPTAEAGSVAVPPTTLLTAVIRSVSPSMSVSLPSSCALVKMNWLSSVAWKPESLTMSGASLTAVTVRLTVAVAIAAPSVIVYVKLAGPL